VGSGFGNSVSPEKAKKLVAGVANFLFLNPFRFSKIAHSTANI